VYTYRGQKAKVSGQIIGPRQQRTSYKDDLASARLETLRTPRKREHVSDPFKVVLLAIDVTGYSIVYTELRFLQKKQSIERRTTRIPEATTSTDKNLE
jgi:hypothetical protein